MRVRSFPSLFVAIFFMQSIQVERDFCLNNLCPVDRFISLGCQPQESPVIPCGVAFFSILINTPC